MMGAFGQMSLTPCVVHSLRMLVYCPLCFNIGFVVVNVQRDEEFDEWRSDAGFPSNFFPRPEFATLHFIFLEAGSKERRLYVQGAKGTMLLSPAHNTWDEPRASMADPEKRVCLHC